MNQIDPRIEQLLEHGHLRHLKMNDHELNLLQYFCIDVILFLAAAIVSGLVVAYR
jgi:hypothetical protein